MHNKEPGCFQETQIEALTQHSGLQSQPAPFPEPLLPGTRSSRDTELNRHHSALSRISHIMGGTLSSHEKQVPGVRRQNYAIHDGHGHPVQIELYFPIRGCLGLPKVWSRHDCVFKTSLPCTVKGCSNWYTLSHSGSRMDHLLNHCPAAYPGSRSEREKGRTVSGRSSRHSPCCSMQSGRLSFSLFFLLGCVYL